MCTHTHNTHTSERVYTCGAAHVVGILVSSAAAISAATTADDRTRSITSRDIIIIIRRLPRLVRDDEFDVRATVTVLCKRYALGQVIFVPTLRCSHGRTYVYLYCIGATRDGHFKLSTNPNIR